MDNDFAKATLRFLQHLELSTGSKADVTVVLPLEQILRLSREIEKNLGSQIYSEQVPNFARVGFEFMGIKFRPEPFEQLGGEYAKILHDNLWDLYAR